jgi:TonB family protein
MQPWRTGRLPLLFAAFALFGLACKHRAGEAPGSLPAGMTRPRVASPIDWSYPPATTAGVAGTLSVRCVITEEGRAEDCQVARSIPELDRWVIAKLEGASFVPATYQGTPVRSSFLIDVRVDIPEAASRWRPPVDPAQIAACQGTNASGCMGSALALLYPDGGTREVDRASRLLGAACAAGLAAACRQLDESFQGPRLLDDVSPPSNLEFRGAEGEVVCWISTMGQAHDCRGPGSAPAAWFIDTLRRTRFSPARFEGEPFETEFVVGFSFRKY